MFFIGPLVKKRSFCKIFFMKCSICGDNLAKEKPYFKYKTNDENNWLQVFMCPFCFREFSNPKDFSDIFRFIFEKNKRTDIHISMLKLFSSLMKGFENVENFFDKIIPPRKV